MEEYLNDAFRDNELWRDGDAVEDYTNFEEEGWWIEDALNKLPND